MFLGVHAPDSPACVNVDFSISADKFSISVAKKHICIYRAYLRFLAYAKLIFSQGEACI